jgi:CRP-like cAMP-binding protein
MPITVKTTTKDRNSGETLSQQALALLTRSLGFKDCPVPLLEELIAAGQFRRMGKGEMIARRGDPMSHVGLVINGMLDGVALHANGHRHLMGLLLPGDFYGLTGMVDIRLTSHTHDVNGRADGDLLQISCEGFRRLRAREPQLVRACELQIVQRLQLVYERMAADPAMPLAERTAGMLHMMGQLYGRAEAGQIVIDIRLSQTDMAEWLGMSRQRVNFALKQLESEGLISLHYSSLTIIQPALLAERARGD